MYFPYMNIGTVHYYIPIYFDCFPVENVYKSDCVLYSDNRKIELPIEGSVGGIFSFHLKHTKDIANISLSIFDFISIIYLKIKTKK